MKKKKEMDIPEQSEIAAKLARRKAMAEAPTMHDTQDGLTKRLERNAKTSGPQDELEKKLQKRQQIADAITVPIAITTSNTEPKKQPPPIAPRKQAIPASVSTSVIQSKKQPPPVAKKPITGGFVLLDNKYKEKYMKYKLKYLKLKQNLFID